MSETCRKQATYNKDKVIDFLDNYKKPVLFNEFEDEIIKKYYKIRPVQAIAEALGKKRKQIYNRAILLGIRKI